LRIVADTNLLVRALTGDNEHQSRAAKAELTNADIVALTPIALCELVWVLRAAYGFSGHRIAEGLRLLVGGANVRTDRALVEAGLTLLEPGGDFADGVIAYEGEQLGGEEFVSFDRRAVRLIAAQGRPARLPG
jgi:predicted nucleic-acid-binding protein